MNDNEIRQNKATKEWVIIAPGRGKRPTDFRIKQDKDSLPEHDSDCPFCPGNEDKLTEIIDEHKSENKAGWQTRVVPNKFPALGDGENNLREQEGIYLKMPAYGCHEVIIETPLHNRDIPSMEADEVEKIVETYHRRFTDALKNNNTLLPILFRNHGKSAGTSLLHPHSQLIVTGFVPRHVRLREEQAQQYYDEYARCVFCDILKFENEDGRRIIAENDTMTAFVPFAAEVPFEVHIFPNKHQADFGKITDREKKDLADILRKVLKRLTGKLNDPDYNYIINSAPRYKADEPHLHWYLQIRPRLTTRAGFEIGSGISINPSVPEEDAKFIRNDD